MVTSHMASCVGNTLIMPRRSACHRLPPPATACHSAPVAHNKTLALVNETAKAPRHHLLTSVVLPKVRYLRSKSYS